MKLFARFRAWLLAPRCDFCDGKIRGASRLFPIGYRKERLLHWIFHERCAETYLERTAGAIDQ